MTDQEILEILADAECELFYRWTDMSSKEPGYEEIKAAHQSARNALETFARAIGCLN